MATTASRLLAQAGIPPLTTEEEDQIILSRITNDERHIKRVMKKFNTYNSLNAQPSTSPQLPESSPAGQSLASLKDAKEAFLVELASFELSLIKSSMVCEAETRQVEEYRREKERIEQEHVTLKEQIEQLKNSLEEAQIVRRRKIEYDLIAERVNTLPPREELERAINALENDMTAIHSEHETQDRIIRAQKSALDDVVTELTSIRSLGKETDKDTLNGPSTSAGPSRAPTPTPADGADRDVSTPVTTVTAPTAEEREEGEEDQGATSASAVATTDDGSVNDNDIEMGEVEEEHPPGASGNSSGVGGLKSRKLPREDLEEGEASDSGSDLTDLPDD